MRHGGKSAMRSPLLSGNISCTMSSVCNSRKARPVKKTAPILILTRSKEEHPSIGNFTEEEMAAVNEVFWAMQSDFLNLSTQR
jgi:hypothetical protein